MTVLQQLDGQHYLRYPIFNIYYFDGEWGEEDELRVEDATAEEVMIAVHTLVHSKVNEVAHGLGRSALAKVVFLGVEVQAHG